MRIDVKLSAEDAAAFNRIVETTGRSKAASIRLWIRADDPGKHRVNTGKSSRAREKRSFCIKEKIQREPLLSPRGYDEHPFFNDPAFKSSWEIYEQVREEMGKKISRQIGGAILTACDNMGIDKAKVALNRAAQGGHVMVIPPTEPSWVDRGNETDSERRKRELLAEYGP